MVWRAAADPELSWAMELTSMFGLPQLVVVCCPAQTAWCWAVVGLMS